MLRREGRCHCGVIEVQWELPPGASPSPRRCGCSFCQRHGSLYVSAPSGSLRVTLDPGNVSYYEFGHRTATFLVCGRCGVLVAALSEIDSNLHAVLNANVLSPPLDLDPGSIPTADYESEDVSERLDRRKARWISNVTVIEQ